MIDLLPYILKSTACFTLCFAFYYFVLRKENALVFNRFYLIATAILSIVLPLSSFTIYLPDFQSLLPLNNTKSAAETAVYYTTETIVSTQPTVNNSINFMFYGLLAYALISLMFLVRFTINVGRIIIQKRKGRKLNYRQSTLVLALSKIAPHSFLKYIFLNEEDYEKGLISEEIIMHEKAHCDQWHTLDILFIETIKILFWWNPIVWLYKKSIQLNHEYLADQFALQDINTIDYQRAIICALENSNSVALGSHFNYCSIKNRFKMMTTQKMKTSQKITKAVMFLPVLVVLFAFAVNVEAQEKVEEVEKVNKVEKATKTTKEVKQETKVKIVLDEKGLSKEDIDELVEEQLKKHGLDSKNVNVNVNTNDGETEIVIKSDGAVFISEDGNVHELMGKDAKYKIIKGELDEELEVIKEELKDASKEIKLIMKDRNEALNKIRVIQGKSSNDENGYEYDVEWNIDEEMNGVEVEVERIARELEIEMEGLEDEMAKIEVHLENKYRVNDRMNNRVEVTERQGKGKNITVIEHKSDDGENHTIEIDGDRIIINGVEMDIKDQTKKKKKRNKRK